MLPSLSEGQAPALLDPPAKLSGRVSGSTSTRSSPAASPPGHPRWGGLPARACACARARVRACLRAWPCTRGPACACASVQASARVRVLVREAGGSERRRGEGASGGRKPRPICTPKRQRMPFPPMGCRTGCYEKKIRESWKHSERFCRRRGQRRIATARHGAEGAPRSVEHGPRVDSGGSACCRWCA